jgi:hypothetical protein
MADIVVEVRGGMVVEIYSDLPELRCVLVDWDNIHAGDHPFCWGGPVPLSAMPEDTRANYREAARREDADQTD